MPQNTTTNKFSSFIGIFLLLGIIGFTVFINFFAKEPTDQPTEEEAKNREIEEPKFRVLEPDDLSILWKLKNLETDSVRLSYNEDRTYIKINTFPKKSYGYKESNINYGTLDFKNYYIKNSRTTFADVEIKYLNNNVADSAQLMEIGNIILAYQIESITTIKQQNLTCVYLKDGREIFLIRESTEIKDGYYKELVERAEYRNDSTRIIFPPTF